MPRLETARPASAGPATGAALAAAILRTLLYADVFDYPLGADEISHFLIGAAAGPTAVQAALAAEPLRSRLRQEAGWYSLAERPQLGALRREHQRHSAELWPAARTWARRLAGLPFVRLVAVTGALARDNAPAGDDIDYLVITAPHRVWLARALCVLLVRAARRGGVQLCPNYVLAETALEQAPRTLYIAYEIAQMTPLAGQRYDAALRRANRWTLDYLPQARGPWRAEADLAPAGRSAGRWDERLLAGRLGEALEGWEQARKQRKFSSAARASTAAVLDADHVKGHFADHGAWVLAEYARRLAEHGLEHGPAAR